MNGFEETLLKLGRDRADDYRRDAERVRLLNRARSEGTSLTSWRWRSAEALLMLASRLSPDHRALVRRLRCPEPLPDPGMANR